MLMMLVNRLLAMPARRKLYKQEMWNYIPNCYTVLVCIYKPLPCNNKEYLGYCLCYRHSLKKMIQQDRTSLIIR